MTALGTRAVHDGRAEVPVNRPAAAPLYESAGWLFSGLRELESVQAQEVGGVIYGSLGGPNHAGLERLVASLEGAEAAVCANGGMTAIAGCLRNLLKPGDRVLAARELFGPTLDLLTVDLPSWGVHTELVDACDLDAVEQKLGDDEFAVVYAETISNPRLRVIDVAALGEVAHRHGAVLMVDNTFASPALCRPLELGADVVVESLTKYISGHYDCIAGAIAGAVEMVEPMRPAMLRAGQLPSPFEAWLCVRGAQTFPLRVAASTRTASQLADWLDAHGAVDAVIYPTLSSHPDYETAARMLPHGCGGVLSLELAGGRAAVERFIDALRLIRLVSSLGGVATTVNHPMSTSHHRLIAEEQQRTGIHPGLVRLAVGIENVDDIIGDLRRGLDAAKGSDRASSTAS